MKIIALEVEGFRSLKKVSWEPGDLNLLIGPNGAGKSNLLRLIELASASAQGRLAKVVQSNGGMEPLVWDGTAPGFEWKVKCAPQGEKKDTLTYELRLERRGRTGEYRIGHEMLADYTNVDRGRRSDGPFKLIERVGERAWIFNQSQGSLKAPEESVPAYETILSLAADPFTQNRRIPPFRAELAEWSVHHDLHTNANASIRMPAVTRHEKRVTADGQNLISVLHTLYAGDREFKREINAAMQAAFGDDFEELVFAPASDQRIQLRVRWKSLKTEQSAADLSDGTLRFLFLLAVLATPEPAPVIAIDEPETGLHPSMLPIVAEYAVEAARKTQVIFTTHSPQFLDAFGETRPVTTVVKWQEGETRLVRLEGAALEEWLSQYSLGSLFRHGELEALA